MQHSHCWVQWDNDFKHSTKIGTKWLKYISTIIFPDQKSIGNLWTGLKNHEQAKDPTIHKVTPVHRYISWGNEEKFCIKYCEKLMKAIANCQIAGNNINALDGPTKVMYGTINCMVL